MISSHIARNCKIGARVSLQIMFRQLDSVIGGNAVLESVDCNDWWNMTQIILVYR